jgi:hypothetical protein
MPCSTELDVLETFFDNETLTADRGAYHDPTLMVEVGKYLS